MRMIPFVGLLLMLPVSGLAHKDRIEPTRTLTASFKTGETATFTFSDGSITSITLRVGANDYLVPRSECAKLRDVHFETVSFLWNGSFESAAKADYFQLQFEMGSERARTFGELPQVQLMFRDGKFAKGTITKQVSKDSRQHSDL